MENGAYNASGAAALAAIGAIWVGIFCIALVFTILYIWFYWRIFEKAGFSGALSLLCLIPGFGQLIAVLILAFGEWPIHQRAVTAPAPAPYVPPPAPPSPPAPLA